MDSLSLFVYQIHSAQSKQILLFSSGEFGDCLFTILSCIPLFVLRGAFVFAGFSDQSRGLFGISAARPRVGE